MIPSLNAPSEASSEFPDAPAWDFSLVLGGPLYQLYRRTRVLKEPVDLVHRRILAGIAVTWLPLLVLAAVSGVAAGGVAVPFLVDLDAHGRFLIGLPLLIGAEVIVHERLRTLVRQFEVRGLIAPEDRPRFNSAITSSWRIRNSMSVEIIILAVGILAGHFIWKDHLTMRTAMWFGAEVNGETELTLPGFWYAYVSLPILRFILLRWCFRLFIWYQFLWRVSRIPLRLNALHPDRAGGLGFLGSSHVAFTPILLAITAVFSTMICNQIWHEGAKLPEFKLEIVTMVLVGISVVLLPQAAFTGQLNQARRTGSRTYGALASRYVDEFRSKWIESPRPPSEQLIGSADIQSLADLGNAYAVVKEMRPLPFSRNDVMRLAIAIALPFAPLMLWMVNVEEIVDRLLRVFV